jgi:hypothetical protein
MAEAGKGAAKGKGHQQQLKAFERQMVHEEAKHLKRAARLKQILDLAKGQDDDKMLARANKLMEREQKRYEQKVQRLKGRMDKVPALEAKAAKEDPDKSAEGKAKAKARKEKPRGGKDKGEDKDKDADAESDEDDSD